MRNVIAFIIIILLSIPLLMGIRVGKVNGTSMEPALKDSQLIVYMDTNNIKVGDIAVYTYEGTNNIKYVVGKLGDHVTINTKGEVYINNRKTTLKINKKIEQDKTYAVGKGYFMSGINKDSRNSFDYGAVASNYTKGKVILAIPRR